jgi:hypothetical protein
MTRDELIETMARAGVRAGIQSEHLSRCAATFMASAIEAAGLAIVPVEATSGMVLSALTQDGKGIWPAMIEAGRI